MIHLVLGVKLKEQENSPLVAVIIHISLTALTTFYIRLSHSHFLLPFQNSGSGRDNWVGIKQAKNQSSAEVLCYPRTLVFSHFSIRAWSKTPWEQWKKLMSFRTNLEESLKWLLKLSNLCSATTAKFCQTQFIFL